MKGPVRLFIVITGCIAAISGLSAQELITPLAGNPTLAKYQSNSKAVKKAALADTLNLPFFDDFSNSDVIPDPSRWDDKQAFVNNNYCVNPVSNGVATLDAIDFEGSIYPDASFNPNSFVADHLTSRPIKLEFNPADSLYFSFLFQPGGLGDDPEEQDSLLLDFYSPIDSTWINIWSSPGFTSDDFNQVMIPLTDERFLSSGFRFRFRNRASLPRNTDYPDKRANVDHWHLDYIRLGVNRFAADTILRDVAFVSPIRSILKDLTSLPWSHFEDARLTALDTRIPVRYQNNDSTAHNVTRSLLIEEPLWGEFFSPGVPSAQDLPAGEDTLVEFDYFYPIDVNRGNSAIIRFKASIRTDEFDPKVNDTVVYNQLFKDYYAYDDGTPEAGYGLRGQGTSNGSVALRFHSFSPDEIGGVDISFNHLYDSINLGYYFKLIVWDDNNGVPGTILLEDGNDHVPGYATYFPGFVRYKFTEPVPVDGDFYVGWRQYNEYMLNVGLDLNNRPNPHVLFYNYQGIWESSKAPGVILLRPFLYREPNGISNTETLSGAITIYPNPASDQVRINIPDGVMGDGFVLSIIDTSGRLMRTELLRDTQIQVADLPVGIYFLNIQSGKQRYHSKLLINR